MFRVAWQTNEVIQHGPWVDWSLEMMDEVIAGMEKFEQYMGRTPEFWIEWDGENTVDFQTVSRACGTRRTLQPRDRGQ